jgi:hypothetical protein
VRWRPLWIGVAGAGIGGAGLALIAIATFLPWFRSGSVLRDSYETISVARTLKIAEGTPLTPIMNAWTMIIPAITLCVVVYAISFRRVAATMAAILAILCGTIVQLLPVRSGSDDAPLGVAKAGPTVTMIGVALVLLGGVGIFVGQHSRVRKTTGGEP